jgi:HEAT repeat protein
MNPRRESIAGAWLVAVVAAACGPAIGPLERHLDADDHGAALALAQGDRDLERELAALLLERAAAANADHAAAGLVQDLAGSRAGRRALQRLAAGDARPAAELARIALERGRRPGSKDLGRWLADDHSVIRAAAARAFGGRLATPELAALLLDPDPGVRLAAVSALAGRDGEPASGAALREALLRDPDPLVRAAVARCGRSLGADALEALRRALGDRALGVRFAALWGLGELGTKDAISLIADRAAGPIDQSAVVALAELSRLGLGPGPDRFVEALGHRDPLVRATALAHVERAGFDADRRRKALLTALGDEDPQVALTAAARLATARERPEAALAAALERVRETSPSRTAEARNLLAVLGSAPAVEELEALLVLSGDEAEILAALPRLRGAAVLRPRFVALLADPRAAVRLAAARAVLAAG